MQSDPPSLAASFVLGAPGVPPRRVPIDRATLTIGRGAANDLVLGDPTVCGEHAVVHTWGAHSAIHDLGSRRGTRVNGRPIDRHALVDGDVVDIGVYRLTYAAAPAAAIGPAAPAGPARRAGPPGCAGSAGAIGRAGSTDGAGRSRSGEPAGRAGAVGRAGAAVPAAPVIGRERPASGAGLEVLTGARAGDRLSLQRPINRISGPNGASAVVALRGTGWSITHLDGPGCPLLNGAPIGPGAHSLIDGDLIELADAMLRFRLVR